MAAEATEAPVGVVGRPPRHIDNGSAAIRKRGQDLAILCAGFKGARVHLDDEEADVDAALSALAD